jgi:hypothetical protein
VVFLDGIFEDGVRAEIIFIKSFVLSQQIRGLMLLILLLIIIYMAGIYRSQEGRGKHIGEGVQSGLTPVSQLFREEIKCIEGLLILCGWKAHL